MPDTGQYNQFPIDWQKLNASKVPYSNATSGLSATDVQDAIDELASEKQDTLSAGDGIDITSNVISTDNDATLTSEVKPAQAKAVGDALSAQETATEEALYTKAPIITDTASGAIATFPDGADGYPLKECVVDVDAVQDLHGYDHPWPAGGGKNLINIDSVTLSAAGNWASDKELDKPTPAGTYTFAVTTSAQSAWNVRFKDENGNSVGLGSSATNIQGRQSVTVTLTGTATKINGYLNAPATMSDFQLEAGSTATSYAPYSNECPISGWSEAKVTRTGKNLSETSSGNSNSNGNVSYTATGAFGTCKANITYTISFTILESNATNFTLRFNNSTNIYTFSSGQSANTRLSCTYTPTVNGFFNFFSSGGTFTASTKVFDNVQVEIGSTASDYVPYVGATYPISWQSEAGTVYGGTLDVTRGKLTVTHAYKVLNGTETWYAITSPANGFRNSGSTDFPGRKSGGEFICNRLYDKGNSLSDLTNTWDAVFASNLNIRTDNLFADVDAFKAWVASNNLECVYELETPVEVDLTTTEITTLLGTNNIFADTGDVEVEYCADTKRYIQKLISQLS